jgi:cytochrome c oxidase subunit 3
MVSMVMLFAGLTSGAYVRMAKGDWLVFDIPLAFYLSTAIIIISSVTINWASVSAKKDNLKNVKTGLLLTLLLGLGFIWSQFSGWNSLVDQKVFFAGKLSNASGSFFYVLTGLHLVHLFAGIIALSVTYVRSLKERYNSQNLLGLQLCATFGIF